MQEVADPSAPWLDAGPERAAAWLDPLRSEWWIAGGWAIDLFVGRGERRRHEDLDVGCFRADFDAVRGALRGWEFFAAADGVLLPLAQGETPVPEVHSVWCRREGETAWALEVMLDERDGTDWVYRRDPTVRRPAHDLTWRANGIPVLRPEVQLLYKSKGIRSKDDVDFRRTAPLLDPDARRWLIDALSRTYPAHAWLRILRDA